MHSRDDHRTLLRSAGFSMVEEIDVTPEYLTTLRAWHREAASRADELRMTQGVQGFEDRQRDRRVSATAVENGLLRRALFVARNA